MKLFSLFLAALFMAPVATAQGASNATVYFYRLQNAIGSRATPTILCDGARIATVRNGQFVSVSLPSGGHVIEALSFAGSRQTVVLDSGDTYFYRADMSIFSWRMVLSGKLTLVLPQQGRSDVAQLQAVKPETWSH